MKAIEHKIKHQYQSTPTNCSQTALSILLGHYGLDIPANEIEQHAPQSINEKGENIGSINQQLATWCLSQDLSVKMYTFDCQVIDQSWSKLSKDKLLQKLELRKDGWIVPCGDRSYTVAYTQSYIEFIKAGGELIIQPNVTSTLLYDLLKNGPALPCVSFSTLYGAERTVIKDGKDWRDDINGRALTHSIVIYGNDEKGNFLVADVDKKPGLIVIEPERMLAAISTAQIECDNLIFQVSKK